MRKVVLQTTIGMSNVEEDQLRVYGRRRRIFY
jgi:hypothetical protein